MDCTCKILQLLKITSAFKMFIKELMHPLAVAGTFSDLKSALYSLDQMEYVMIYECSCIPFVHPLAKRKSLSDLKHALFP